MKLRILKPGDEAALEAFLAPRLASSMLLMSNARAVGVAYTGARPSGVYAAAFENGEMQGVVAHYWNNVLILQAPAEAAALCRLAVAASGRPVEGVMGPYDQAAMALAAVGIEPGQGRMDEREKLYRLTLTSLVVPKALPARDVIGRRAVLRDLETLAEWRMRYEAEAVAGQTTPESLAACRAAMAQRIAAGTVWVLEDRGRLVAMTAFNAQTQEAVQVGGVWTPPDLRRRGYARCVVAASLLDARAGGTAMAILFTGHGNVAAQRAYAALGFELIGDYRLVFV